MTVRTCDTAMVTVSHAEAGTMTFLVPAYTVPSETLRERLEHLQALYFEVSSAQRMPTSLADYAMYLLAKASTDPKEQQI